MACVEKWKVIWCICFVVIRALRTEALDTEALGPAPEFLKHVVIRPKIFHGREKRSLQSTRKHQNGLEHEHDIVVSFNLHGKDHLLDLRLNRELIPNNYFERHQNNGSHVTRRPRGKDFELCHYIGKLRGAKNSWAALSTCNGLSGVVYNGESLHYIEKSKSGDSSNGTSNEGENEGNFDDGVIDGSVDHYIYSHEDLDTNLNRTCGYSGTAENHHITHFHADKLRYKRSDGSDNAQDIRGPYNANKMSRYVELVLVVDNRDYKELGESLPKVYTHCKNIANIINALYMPLNIFIALVGVVVWSEMDEISLSENGDTTLTNFLHYRRAQLFKEYPNDNAQLLTRMQFANGVVGKALKGPICTFEFSGGVSMDHSPVIGLVATTVAHEMGHNFGMEHDSAGCECPEERCIMAPSSSSMSPTHWSSCSMEYLAFAYEHGMDYCLRNKPKGLFGSPVCGNGFVEAGEQCDCGLKEHCNNPCCNASTCMLYSNASCATGECCDLKTCRPRTAGSVCRTADHECDLPEYCTGQSEYCPKDVFKMDGETCDRGKAFCYQGSCRSHSDQCKLLWGPSGKSSDLQCYKMNIKGSRYGNCGYNRLNQSYIKCETENIQCGMLHCMHLNERLEFGMETVSILSHSFLSSGDKNIIPCRSVIVDLGLNEVDPGLAPDGAKCGPDMMCVNQKCMNVSSLRANTKEGACPMGCSGNGVCNSNGHCHCKPGFAPPICDYPGIGGSADSGPAADPNARQEVIVALYLVFLGIVPFVALVALFTYYMRRNPVFWRKKPRSIIIIEKKSSSGLHPRGGSSDNGPKSGHMINDNSRASLLPHSEPSAPVCDDSPITSLQNNLLGQFKGFSITPLPAKSSSTTSSMPATCLPTRPAPQPVSPPKVPSNVAVVAPVRPAPKIPPTSVGLALNSHEQPPTLPPANAVPSRPAISSPVLDATTSCTAQELLSTAPIRAAPTVPENRPSRPVSSPIIPEETHDTKPGKPIKDQSYPALTRIASFMARNQKDGAKKDNVSGGSLRINKLDRDTLRNLEISNPIPQKEIEVPGVALPAGSNKVVVMRAQSMRDSENKKPHIHSFGSMRASGAKRPTSIPVAARPTSPPPPRPPSIGLPGYQTPGKIENTYDDCLNMLTENGVPLANIDEESPNSATDNIYAVIEESPTDRRERKEIVLPKKLEHTSPTNEYNLPKALENSVSTGSSESMGLLGEIVSEIQARNTDSIYSTSTLKRKKENDDETSSTITIADSDLSDTKSNQIYVNTPWQGYDKFNSASKSCASSNSSNSGYLSPINATQTNGGPKMFVETESKNNSDVPSVPDASAPSYKPYSSSLQRNNGPFAALYNKTPAEAKLQKDSVNQTVSNLSDNKGNRFMPNNVNKILNENSLRRTNANDNPSKVSLNSAKVPVSSSVTLNKNNISISVTSSKSAQEGVKKQGNVSAQPKSATSLAGVKGSASIKSPIEQKVSGGGKIDNAEVSSLPSSSKQDLVIKTANVESKQVLENKLDVKNPASLKTVPKVSSFRTGRTPIPAPKPVVIPNVKSSGSIVPVKTKQPLSKTAAIKQSAPGSDTSSNNKPDIKSGVIKPVSKSSNVASLQQKFETGAKQPVQRTVNNVSNRNNTNPKTPHSDPDVKR